MRRIDRITWHKAKRTLVSIICLGTMHLSIEDYVLEWYHSHFCLVLRKHRPPFAHKFDSSYSHSDCILSLVSSTTPFFILIRVRMLITTQRGTKKPAMRKRDKRPEKNRESSSLGPRRFLRVVLIDFSPNSSFFSAFFFIFHSDQRHVSSFNIEPPLALKQFTTFLLFFSLPSEL